jgi:dihydroorotate dehydrogenase electron transfer subunit
MTRLESLSGQRHIAPRLERMRVLSNERVAESVGLVALHAPFIAEHVRPGQFVHLRISEESGRLLRRPFAVHRRSGERIELLYQVVGAGTRELSLKEPGDEMDAIGPVGHGWTLPDGTAHVLLVAGGLGAAPLGLLAEDLAARGVAVVVAHGAPTANRLVGKSVFEAVARRVELSTDDGSAGRRGRVTEVSEALLAAETFDTVYACGPEVMQRVVAAQAANHGAVCEVSLERLMACGIGACLSCMVSTVHGPRRACVNGPVFLASEILWDSSEFPGTGEAK